ncbi:putative phage abortive infection protein [Gaetbulibacter jejuensis]|uniref:Phage abortive infection protein n=1 Tax=Gaetbulibacter jejuensis TaxID=584607 RepID=A0ABN1JIC4_9FLAO
MENENKESKKLWSKGVIALIVFAFLLIIFSFIAPVIFTQPSGKVAFGNDTGVIGDTIGGIMNPFIALAGVIVTGLAFYMQLRANQIQISNFKKELDAQKDQNKLSQFESQFYEMLRLHKENVNEIEVEVFEFSETEIKNAPTRNNDLLSSRSPVVELSKVSKTIKGRDVFLYFSNELEITYNFLEENEELKENERFSLAYRSFFNGALHQIEYDELEVLIKEHKTKFLSGSNYISNSSESMDVFYSTSVISKYPLLKGYENSLGHYYRHLFHTVKFIALQDEKFISYQEKRKYLRILRAQLSNYEQAMLFYNYIVYAPEWEKGNKFFTDYRMIHNLNPNILIDSKTVKEKHEELKKVNARAYKEEDYVFESQKGK